MRPLACDGRTGKAGTTFSGRRRRVGAFGSRPRTSAALPAGALVRPQPKVPSRHERRDRRRPPADGRGRRADAGRRRQRRGRVPRRGVRLVGRREPTHRTGRRRLPARPRAGDGRSRLLDFFVAVPGARASPGAASARWSRGRRLRLHDAGLPDRSCFVAVPGTVAGLEPRIGDSGRLPWREIARARDRARTRRVSSSPARRRTCTRSSTSILRSHRGRPGNLQPARRPARRGRPARDARPGGDAGADRARAVPTPSTEGAAHARVATRRAGGGGAPHARRSRRVSRRSGAGPSPPSSFGTVRARIRRRRRAAC